MCLNITLLVCVVLGTLLLVVLLTPLWPSGAGARTAGPPLLAAGGCSWWKRTARERRGMSHTAWEGAGGVLLNTGTTDTVCVHGAGMSGAGCARWRLACSRMGIVSFRAWARALPCGGPRAPWPAAAFARVGRVKGVGRRAAAEHDGGRSV